MGMKKRYVVKTGIDRVAGFFQSIEGARSAVLDLELRGELNIRIERVVLGAIDSVIQGILRLYTDRAWQEAKLCSWYVPGKTRLWLNKVVLDEKSGESYVQVVAFISNRPGTHEFKLPLIMPI